MRLQAPTVILPHYTLQLGFQGCILKDVGEMFVWVGVRIYSSNFTSDTEDEDDVFENLFLAISKKKNKQTQNSIVFQLISAR